MRHQKAMQKLSPLLAGVCVLMSVLPAGAVDWAYYSSPLNNAAVAASGAGSYWSPSVCPDGRGGMWVAYVDDGASADNEIVVKRLAADGTSDIVRYVTYDTYEQDQPQVCPSDSGGVYVVWRDNRNSATTSHDIFVQYLGPEGLVRWTTNGVLVTNAAGTQQTPYVGSGYYGLVVGWLDDRNGSANSDIYVGRINKSGVLQTSVSGSALCTDASDQLEMTGAPGNDGLLLTWRDNRNGSYDVYGDYVSSFGTAYWSSFGGTGTLCMASGSQLGPRVTADESGGAYVVWEDVRGADYDLYLQRAVNYGELQYGSTGTLVCNATLNQFDPEIVTDGSGGAIVVWLDDRTTPRAIYAQRMAPSGSALWTANGVNAASAIVGTPSSLRVVADGLGGVFIVWTEARVSGSDLYGQRLNASGSPQWGAGGVLISGAYLGQQNASLALGSESSLQLAWEDAREGGGDYGIYAQRVDRYGYLGDAAPRLVDVSDVLGDQGGRVRLDWTPGYVEFDPFLQVGLYYVLREVPAALAARMHRAGARIVQEPSDPSPGERVLLARADATAVSYWEYVGQSPAFLADAYSFVASTTSDSVIGVPATTRFMVQARNASGTRYWFSNSKSGYSADNLAPLAPSPFSGVYASGVTMLSWDANLESDLAGYRLYRGTSPGFVPDADNLVAVMTTPGHVDPVGAPFYYKLTAVDVHQNESAVATLLPAGTLDADLPPPRALSFSAPWPNPAERHATLRFELPRVARTRLAILDAAGREVRVLLEGTQPAGQHAIVWDLSDATGHSVPPGLYLARLESQGRFIVRRMTVIR